jgi:hypothetical protein
VRELLERVRSEMITFATAEWVDLAPDIVDGLEDTVRKLQPGVTLGMAYPPSPPALPTPPAVVDPAHKYGEQAHSQMGPRPHSWVNVSFARIFPLLFFIFLTLLSCLVLPLQAV